MRTRNFVTIATWLFVVGMVIAPRIANACAVCGLGPNDTAGHAFNTSVLFMMGVPYSTVLIIGGAVYLVWRKASRQKDLPIDGTHKY